MAFGERPFTIPEQLSIAPIPPEPDPMVARLMSHQVKPRAFEMTFDDLRRMTPEVLMKTYQDFERAMQQVAAAMGSTPDVAAEIAKSAIIVYGEPSSHDAVKHLARSMRRQLRSMGQAVALKPVKFDPVALLGTEIRYGSYNEVIETRKGQTAQVVPKTEAAQSPKAVSETHRQQTRKDKTQAVGGKVRSGVNIIDGMTASSYVPPGRIVVDRKYGISLDPFNVAPLPPLILCPRCGSANVAVACNPVSGAARCIHCAYQWNR